MHWFHRDDCVLLPGREIEPRVKYPSHPAGTAIWEHPTGCLCERHVYMELNLDRDDDEVEAKVWT